MIGKCKDCGKVHHYPRAICPHCFSQNLELQQAKGTGVIYTFSPELDFEFTAGEPGEYVLSTPVTANPQGPRWSRRIIVR